MKILLYVLLMITADPTEIARNNKLKSVAEEAFLSGNYEKAAANYSQLYDSLNLRDPKIGLNLAHSYYALGDTANATLNYQSVVAEGDNKVKSIAYQQLGVIAKKPETLKESLAYLKSSIKSDPTNEEARYNYELVKKQLEQQQQNQDQQQDQDKSEDQEPSEFAKQIKAAADRLRHQGDFEEALLVFNEGLKKDKTVSSYSDEIGRLKKVIGK